MKAENNRSGSSPYKECLRGYTAPLLPCPGEKEAWIDQKENDFSLLLLKTRAKKQPKTQKPKQHLSLGSL